MLSNCTELLWVTVTYHAPVIQLVFKEGANIDVANIRELITECGKLSGHKPFLLLCDVTAFITITPEARKMASDPEESSLVKATAVVINNLALKLVADFFVSFNKPGYKFKVFKDKQKAMDWLLKSDQEILKHIET